MSKNSTRNKTSNDDLLDDNPREQIGGNRANAFAKDQLKSIIERIERLEQEKKTISDDIKDIYAESKGNGFDVKAIKAIIKIRKQDPTEREEQEAVLETYLLALGMI